MLNFVLCDDNFSFLSGLEKMLSRLFVKHNLDAHIGFTTDSPSKLIEYIKNNTVDVVFLDITLKNKNSGLNIAEEIRKINKTLHLIFITGHFEFIMEAYKVNTFDYLIKPVSQNKLEETILRLIDYLKTSFSQFIKINGTTFINQDNIHFIKREGMKIIYYTKEGEFEGYSSFSKLKNSLPVNFVRCHKSFIANISNIHHIESNTNTIFFDGDHKCYIGPKYKNKFMEVIDFGIYSNNLDSTNNTK